MQSQDEGAGSYQTTTNTSLQEIARETDIILPSNMWQLSG
jgi:hypothetical protein